MDVLSRQMAGGRLTCDVVLGVVFVSCLVGGCGRRATGPIAQDQTNLSWLGSMYAMYISQQQGHAPKTIGDLQKFVEAKTTAEQLARLKVANVGELFVSPHDNKPFVLVSYDKFPSFTAGQQPPLVLYEATAQDGKRSVAFLGGNTRTLDETEFQKVLPPSVKTAR